MEDWQSDTSDSSDGDSSFSFDEHPVLEAVRAHKKKAKLCETFAKLLIAAAQSGTSKMSSFQTGVCPDRECNARITFPSSDSFVQCSSCGKRINKNDLLNLGDVTNQNLRLVEILRRVINDGKTEKDSDHVQVSGLTNYQCKTISPLLTNHGMDKSGEAKLLADMGKPSVFDVSILSHRSFLIPPQYIDVHGYGRDRTGSVDYLKDLLDRIKEHNGKEERLLPIHADGDGHCLVHAVSRALVGRELFWHALRINLENHLREKIDIYKRLFKDFYDEAEWETIIAECDPDFQPPEGEQLGLRNIHVFGLANVLRRPIILLDSLSGLHSSGDYAGVFLPGLSKAEQCRDKDGRLNRPICLAWSNKCRNHYIALVGIQDRPLPKLPSFMVPKSWFLPAELIPQYIDLETNGDIVIGSQQCINEKYLIRLVSAMEKVYLEMHGMTTRLISEAHKNFFLDKGCVGIKPELVQEYTAPYLQQKQVYTCLVCGSLVILPVGKDMLRPGGELYDLATSLHGKLKGVNQYDFKRHGVVCAYNEKEDTLEINFESEKSTFACEACQARCKELREVREDGSVVYQDLDRTRTPSAICHCGFKHYYKEKEYDKLPTLLSIPLTWGGKQVKEQILWVEGDSDPSLNSNVYEIAQGLVQKHFPGEFGSERLVQTVVDTILRLTATKEQPKAESPGPSRDTIDILDSDNPVVFRPDRASKFIKKGPASKTVHKEELNMSEKEKQVGKSIREKAPLQQKKKSAPQVPKEPVVTSPEVKPKSPPKAAPPSRKMIRVTSSEGKTITMPLEEDMTFDKLQEKLAKGLDIPAHLQKIRYGFPPRELVAPPNSNDPLPLQHGDRVSVEKVKDVSEEVPPAEPMDVDSRGDANRQVNSQMIQLANVLAQATDDPDTKMRSLEMVARLQGRDFWEFCRERPELFEREGVFVAKAKKDHTLTDGIQIKFELLPNKIFRYSAAHDKLEVAVGKHGFYPVSRDVEQRPAPSRMVSSMAELRRLSSDQESQPSPSTVPFSGEGQRLSAVKPDENVKKSKMEGERVFERVGPGFTVLKRSEEESSSQAERMELEDVKNETSSPELGDVINEASSSEAKADPNAQME